MPPTYLAPILGLGLLGPDSLLDDCLGSIQREEEEKEGVMKEGVGGLRGVVLVVIVVIGISICGT